MRDYTESLIAKYEGLIALMRQEDGVTEFEAELATLLPTAFVAVTVKVQAVPLVRPVTVIGLAVPVPVKAPGLEVTVQPVIVDPPLLTGAVKVTVA